VATDAPLTIEDLERLSGEAFHADDPLAVAAQLTEAAERDRIADPADVGYAFMLAAEIHGDAADAATALTLADRAVAAYQRWAEAEARAGRDADATVDVGWPRAYRAQMLFELGRDDEAMADLDELRTRLASDDLAASYVSETLEDAGRAELAVEWLTAALDELRQAHQPELPEELGGVVYQLAVIRHRIRGELDLPHDDYDELADEFLAVDEQVGQIRDQDVGGDSDLVGEPVLLWWPREELAAVAFRWPELAETWGPTDWDEARQRRQTLIEVWSETGQPALSQVTGGADGFATFLADKGLSADRDGLGAYTDHLADRAEGRTLPPGRNEPCWCGSGSKYKKCCLPLSR
jgi:tetratricopeptide (TPR) repeat protein